MTMQPILLILVGLLAAVLIAGAVYATRMKRRAVYRNLALQLGLTYASVNRALFRKHRYLGRIQQRLKGPIRDIVSGLYQNFPVHAFHYTYAKPAAGAPKSSRHESCFLLEQDRRFPDLHIHPAHRRDRAHFAPGMPAMPGARGAFAEKFSVHGKDQHFAQTVLHPRMVNFLLQHPELTLILEDTAIVITIEGPLRPEAVQPYLDLLVHIRQLMPETLYEA